MQPPRLYDPAANRGISDVPNRNVSSRVHYVLIMIPRTIVYRKYFFPNHTQKHVLIVAAAGQGVQIGIIGAFRAPEAFENLYFENSC